MNQAKPQGAFLRLTIQGFYFLPVFALLLGLTGVGVWVYLSTPRAEAADVEQSIAAALPVGSSEQDVRAWLVARGMSVGTFEATGDEDARYIESWVPNPEAPLELLPRDIRIRFFFDENERLTRFTVAEESGF